MEPEAVAAARSAEPPQKRGRPSAHDGGAEGASPHAGVRIEVRPGTVAVGTLSVGELKRCAHAVLSLFFLPAARGASRPRFRHLFELGGEVSLAVEEEALGALGTEEPQSAAILDAAFAKELTRGWRVLDVTKAHGGEGVGILSAVCVPLASLPLLNVSTPDHSYVLVHEDNLELALERLRPKFEVVQLAD